ncbi:helix-turn-helix domain-containing protein [Myroides odoratus]|uniref:helix-turn-helix domain-containing protein n=1 Tax=Myroides odoratus TaxID=256 RepID=UPI0033424B1B
MSGKLILEGITTSAFIELIADVVVEKLKVVKEQDVLMTRHEAAKYLRIGLSTLSRWTSEGRVPSHGIGGKIYYYKSEIEGAMETLKV